MERIEQLSNSGVPQSTFQKKEKKEKIKGKRNSFSEIFNDSLKHNSEIQATVLESEDELVEVLDKIYDLGEQLKKDPVFAVMNEYKKAVKSFLQYVVNNSFTLSEAKLTRFQQIKRKGKPALRSLDVIDQKLESLSKAVMSSQQDRFSIIARIDEITGLLIDHLL